MRIILIIIRILFIPIKIIHRIVYGPSPKRIIGYAWYSEKEYQKIMATSYDCEEDRFENYREWLEYAKERISEFKAIGWIVIKVSVANKDLKKWLRKNKLSNISENREKYIEEKLALFFDDAKI